MMLKKLLIALTLLLIVATPSVASESKTLWDVVEKRSNLKGLNPELIWINDDPWTFKGNKDYEVLIDVMITVLEDHEIERDPEWYEDERNIFLAGFALGFLISK
jgi:hypothetical protein